ncbi:hypothetical protein IGB42_04107 [Andreprevotia sp. IGB-42]|uniref:beta-1,6-N-acetylglucosaminyltransferase n=1 Tax=Andreprevotia sp. IGB-42 TaxID=2497473 RepID=UPI0013599965|nr:beta-1,6-N-acetylglucosaminyltransferase [Andreprevotia sp. IGB-42]KAF0811409.1 hypothetical protein IGB42_04107 [Andreprevotia sp. IGB-42]
MRIAYLILAHAHPAQLGRLVARLATPDTAFYLHIDANTPAQTFAAIGQAMPAGAAVTFVERVPCRWGGFSLVAATLRLMRAALADGCDWLVLLSGQDYPLKSNTEIAARLLHGGRAGYIDSRSVAEFDVRYRWQAFHFEALNRSLFDRGVQKLQRLAGRLGVHRRLPMPLQAVRAGSQWWCLHADAGQAILAFVAAQPQLPDFFRKTLVPDEMFFQTMLAHTPFAEQVAHDALRHLEWADGAWSPRTFSADDLPALLASPALFARKFAADGVLADVLDAALASSFAAPTSLNADDQAIHH